MYGGNCYLRPGVSKLQPAKSFQLAHEVISSGCKDLLSVMKNNIYKKFMIW